VGSWWACCWAALACSARRPRRFTRGGRLLGFPAGDHALSAVDYGLVNGNTRGWRRRLLVSGGAKCLVAEAGGISCIADPTGTSTRVTYTSLAPLNSSDSWPARN